MFREDLEQDNGKQEDGDEKHEGECRAVSHFELDKALIIDGIDYGGCGTGWPAPCHQKHGAKGLHAVDEVKGDDQTRDWAQEWQGNVGKQLPVICAINARRLIE
jgi:hypothetical protein